MTAYLMHGLGRDDLTAFSEFTGIDPDAKTPIQSKAEEALGLDMWLAKPLFSGDNTLGELREMVAQYAAAEDEGALEDIASGWGACGDEDEDYEDDDDWDVYA